MIKCAVTEASSSGNITMLHHSGKGYDPNYDDSVEATIPWKQAFAISAKNPRKMEEPVADLGVKAKKLLGRF